MDWVGADNTTGVVVQVAPACDTRHHNTFEPDAKN
jgi:hypothetical protein